jgi:hypothetical protein
MASTAAAATMVILPVVPLSGRVGNLPAGSLSTPQAPISGCT